MFAFNALKSVVWGSSDSQSPPKTSSRPFASDGTKPTFANTSEPFKFKSDKLPPEKKPDDLTDPFTGSSTTSSGVPFRVTQRKTIFDNTAKTPDNSEAKRRYLFEATPAAGRPPASPTKSILLPRGATPGKKKSVAFHASVPNKTTPEQRNRRVRSGLPHDLPGKFPSPWTPRTGQTPTRLTAAGQRAPQSTITTTTTTTSLNDLPQPVLYPTINKKRRIETVDELHINEDSRVEDFLDEPEFMKERPRYQNGDDPTFDLNVPKSQSGKYWKSQAESTEALASEKVTALRERYNTIKDYAKRKDAICTELAEKLRESNDKNRLLKEELRRIQRWTESADPGNALAEAMRLLSDKDAKLNAAAAELQTLYDQLERTGEEGLKYKEMLNDREQEYMELSMNMFNTKNSVETEEQLASLQLEVTQLKSTITSLEREKSRLEAKALTTGSLAGDSSSSRLREKISALEKEKSTLRSELREQTATNLKTRRESERALRAEISNMTEKLSTSEREKEQLRQDLAQLQNDFQSLNPTTITSSTTQRELELENRTLTRELREARDELAVIKQIHRPSEGLEALDQNDDPFGAAPIRSTNTNLFNSPPINSAYASAHARARSRSPRKLSRTPLAQPSSPPIHPPHPDANLFDLPPPSSLHQSSPIQRPASTAAGAPPSKIDFSPLMGSATLAGGSAGDLMSFTPPSKPMGAGLLGRSGGERQLHQEAEQSFGGYARMKASPRPSMMAFSPETKKPAQPTPRVGRQSLVERRFRQSTVGAGSRASLGGTAATKMARGGSGSGVTGKENEKPSASEKGRVGGVGEFMRKQREEMMKNKVVGGAGGVGERKPVGMDEERMKAAQERLEARKREREAKAKAVEGA